MENTLPPGWHSKFSQTKGRVFFWHDSAPTQTTWIAPKWPAWNESPWDSVSLTCRAFALAAVKTLWNVKDCVELDGQDLASELAAAPAKKECLAFGLDSSCADLFKFAKVEKACMWVHTTDARPVFALTDAQMQAGCKDRWELVQSQRLSDAIFPVFDWAETEGEQAMREKVLKLRKAKESKLWDSRHWQFVAMFRVWHLRVKK